MKKTGDEEGKWNKNWNFENKPMSLTESLPYTC